MVEQIELNNNFSKYVAQQATSVGGWAAIVLVCLLGGQWTDVTYT